MNYAVGALIVFGILLAVSVFGYWRASASADRMDRHRQRAATYAPDQTQYRA